MKNDEYLSLNISSPIKQIYPKNKLSEGKRTRTLFKYNIIKETLRNSINKQ